VKTGQAIVRLPSGAQYEGTVLYDGQAVTLEGCRRHVVNSSDPATVRRYPSTVRTWPVSAVAVIEWQDASEGSP
jgi:hypothetical protein